MKTVVILAGFLAVALATITPPHYDVKTTKVSAEFVARQKQILSLFHNGDQVDVNAEYYKIGKDYDVEANINNYTDKKAVNVFLALYKQGFMPKNKVFSVFNEQMRKEAIALFHLFYYAKDFETFYKTAAFARVHFFEGQFFYAFTIAIQQRPDTQGFVIPAPYEVYPEYFTNMESIYKARRVQMQNGVFDEHIANEYSIFKENDFYVFYSNYSNYLNYENKEYKLSYFTEDIGMNSLYFYFHTYYPFWMESKDFKLSLEDRRGETYFFLHQRILAQYYMERLSNGLGEIPDFSWYQPVKAGYTPYLTDLAYPFIGRQNNYYMHNEKNYEEVRFLDTYEKSFLQFLQKGKFKAFNQEINFHEFEALDFVGNYWQGNPSLYEKMEFNRHQRSYEIIARHLLSAVPESIDEYYVAPAALMFYQTSLRDPVFYQLYNKIMKYMLTYKEYLQTYTQEDLHYVGVKINDVKVDKLVTFFEYFDYDVTNSVYLRLEQFNSTSPRYIVRQPRLNYKPFSVTIDVKSDVEKEAVFKIFLGPKYDSNGFPITLENNWMNFVELDWFKQKLTPGQNKIERSSEDFLWYKEDSVPMTQIYKYLEEGTVPYSMSQEHAFTPKRMMLPKGKEGGFPFQLFVFVYPYAKSTDNTTPFLIDSMPLSYPLDRRAYETYFKQPNMFFEDVFIYFEGEHFPNNMNSPYYVPHPVKQ